MEERYLRLKEVIKTSGLSRNTVLRRSEKGVFPRKYSLGGKLIGWKESEIKKWVSNPEGYGLGNQPTTASSSGDLQDTRHDYKLPEPHSYPSGQAASQSIPT